MIAPYAQGAFLYFRHGWSDVFPLGRPGQALAKFPPPTGVTGYDAAPVGFERIRKAATNGNGSCNLGIRMPRQVIGLDVDEYADHGGAATLAAMEAELGPLPPTYRNSARGSGDSGHRYYRTGLGRIVIPGAEELITKRFGPNIEVLHYGRRYAVAWPSLNPAASMAPYLWYAPDGTVMDGPPRVIDIPVLPPAHQAFLTAEIDSPAAKRTSGGNLRAAPAAAVEDDEDFESAGMTIRLSVATANIDQQIQALLHMQVGEVNKVIGGATIWLARMANAGVITLEEARALVIAAVKANGKHSDGWNIANGRKWTLDTRVSDALSQGLNRDPYTLQSDPADKGMPAVNVYADMIERIRQYDAAKRA